MLKLGKAGLLAAVGVVALATSAQAQSRQWTVCGGNAFNTCASVYLNVTGTSVNVQVWNLSGFYGTWASTVFTGIGFEHVGTAEGVAGSLTMSGPARAGNSPATWALKNDRQIGGGVNLDLVSSTGTGVDNGIASGCATDLPGGSTNLWQNPCSAPGAVGGPGWVVLQFTITGTWNVATTDLLVKGQNGPDGASTQCITGVNCSVVPEPITMVLLGTGLAGMGGVGLIKRRRKDEVV